MLKLVAELLGQGDGQLLGAARALRAAAGAAPSTLERREIATAEEAVLAQLGEDGFARAVTEGAALDPDRAVELAKTALLEASAVG